MGVHPAARITGARHPAVFPDTRQQLRRRLDASHRCEVLVDGRRDPAVAVDWPYTVESARRAWRHLAGCGLMSETVANVLRDVA